MGKKADKQKLRLWQERLSRNESAYSAEEAKMDEREALYRGDRSLRKLVDGERKKKTPHVRNICAEIIEAQVSSSIPMPKVTAQRPEDEDKARLIEDMLRNEIDRGHFEEINDMMERTVPIQGGGAFLLEWDNTRRTHFTVGELSVSAVHPKQIVPQDGVYTGVEDMDYIILKVPQTKEYLRRRYGVSVEDESEEAPEVRGGESAAEDLVTQYLAYYRNDAGGIGLYSWAGDTELIDLSDYQARRLRRCKKCGMVEPLDSIPLDAPSIDGSMPYAGAEREKGKLHAEKKVCPYCKSADFEETEEEFEEVYVPIVRAYGGDIPGAVKRQVASETEVDENGMPILEIREEPTKIPYYKPDIFPVILQKNVSIHGSFLGDSDIDKICDQQNTTNRLEAKIIEKLVKSGSYITLPDTASIEANDEDMKIIRPGNAADASMIGVHTMEGDISQDIVYLKNVYEEARQIIGITDSFQGRADRTATSGKAKEFAAAQSAGRLESKRVMKNAAYAALFEAMFKFKLAYTDEPRPVVSKDISGNPTYRTFSRYDFLEKDEAGEWHWNDRFLFSCDTTAPLAANREAMWQETRMNLQTGAFGDPANPKTLILFWTKMEMLHYPGAGETKRYLEEEMRAAAEKEAAMQKAQQMAQMAAMEQQKAAQEQQQMAEEDAMQRQEAEAIMADTVQRAREDAARALM